MTLSFIILHHRARALLRLCLQSLQHHPPGCSFEIMVVDSEAEEETEEMIAEEFPAIAYYPHRRNTGYAGGVNYGLERAQGDFLLILNPDIVVQPRSVQTLLDFMQSHSEVGLAGPRLLSFGRQRQSSSFRFYRPSTVIWRRTWLGKSPWGRKALERFRYAEREMFSTWQMTDWLMGSALLTRKEAVAKVGKMDERFFLYFEDVDWAKRFWENGYKVAYCPQSVMYHYHERRSRAGLDVLDVFLRRESRWHLQSGLKYFLKHGWRYHSGPELYAKHSS